MPVPCALDLAASILRKFIVPILSVLTMGSVLPMAEAANPGQGIAPLSVNVDYTAAPLSGYAPLSVSFNDITPVSLTSWQWLFGDGASSAEETPMHNFRTPGAYTVTFTGTNDSGSASVTKTDIIHVSACPNPPVSIGTVPFETLQAAYNAAFDNDIIKVQAASFYDDPVLNKDRKVILQGGYDCSFNPGDHLTSLNSLTIIDGTVEIDKVELRNIASPDCIVNQPIRGYHVGNIAGSTRIVQGFVMEGYLQMVDVMFGTYGRTNTKDLIFHLRDDLSGEASDLATVTVNASKFDDYNWHRFEFPPVKSSRGTQYYIILESPQSSSNDALTAFASSGNPYSGGYLLQQDGSTDNDLTFRACRVADGNGIEYFTWLDLTADNWDRKIYRSRATDISMTFGDRAIMAGGFYEHFFSYNFYDMFDYFCIPDDLVISYDDTFVSWVRAYGLKWTVEHGLLDNRQRAFLRHVYNQENGYNPLTYDYNKGNGVLPPADITVQHDMSYGENYVPMTIRVKNRHDKPLRYIYVFQDGAWMTQGEPNQLDVHQYWDDGDYGFSRVWYIDGANRSNKNNWVGMYNDKHGGMFAATYAPPESVGIRYHAAWNRRWDQVSTSGGLAQPDSLDPFGYTAISPDWYRYENLLSNVDALAPSSSYDNAYWKWHGTVIDFGVLQPNEERTQIIVKIMFTGYRDRVDMHNRMRSILSRIPAYSLPVYPVGGN